MKNRCPIFGFLLLVLGLLILWLIQHFVLPLILAVSPEIRAWVDTISGALVAIIPIAKFLWPYVQPPDQTEPPGDKAASVRTTSYIGRDVGRDARTAGRDFIETQIVQSISQSVVDNLLRRVEKLEQDRRGELQKPSMQERLQAAEDEIAKLKSETVQKSARLLDEYLAQERWDDLLEESARLLKYIPENANIYNNRGVAYADKGDLDRAIAEYARAVQLDPEDAKAYTNRGNALEEKGDLDSALTDHDKAIELDPAEARVYSNRGNVHRAKGNIDAALQDYNVAIDLNSLFAAAYNNRGTIYTDMNDFDQALVDFNRAIEINTEYAVAYSNRGTLHYNRGNFNAAISDYTKAITRNPEDVATYTISWKCIWTE